MVRASFCRVKLTALVLALVACLVRSQSCQVNGDTARKIYHNEGWSEDMIDISFEADFDSSTDEFSFSESSSNTNVLLGTNDTVMSDLMEELLFDRKVYNLTVTFEFDRCPGDTNYTLTILRGNNIYCSLRIEYRLVGVCIYDEGTSGAGITVLSGPDKGVEWKYQDVVKLSERSYSVYIMYPNGTDSSNELPSGALSTMQWEYTAYQGQVLFGLQCLIDGATWDGIDAVLKEGCGFGFSTNAHQGQWDGVNFGIKLELYRVGPLGLKLTWPDFNLNSDFEDEYSLSLNIMISGKPPPVVVRVEPNKAFLPSGGEDLTVTVFNLFEYISMSFHVNGSNSGFPMKPGTVRNASNFNTEVKFVTMPGSGTDLTWSLQLFRSSGIVNSVDLTNPPYLFSYMARPRLDSISPSGGSELGGTTVTASGTFGGFSIDRGDSVLLGNQPISSSLIQSVSETEIIFVTPPKATRSFTVDVIVVISSIPSNALKFHYHAETISATISVTGASQVSPGVYDVGRCSDTEYTVIPAASGDDSYSYSWSLSLVGEVGNLVAVEDRNQTTVYLAQDALTIGSSYLLSCKVQGLATGLVTTVSITVNKIDDVTLGVNVYPLADRTIGIPSSKVRAFASVTLPDPNCYSAEPNIMYEWTFKDQTFVFSPENTSLAKGTMTPTKLGRMFVIEKDALDYGPSEVHLKAYIPGTTLKGFDSESIMIRKSPLAAIIGSGEDFTVKDSMSSFELSGAGSFDPDGRATLSYSWECLYSTTSERFEGTTNVCEADLLPTASEATFTVSTEKFNIWVKYALTVSDGKGRSAKAYQVIKLVDYKIPTLQLQLQDAVEGAIDKRYVKHYDDVILVPSVPKDTFVFYEVVQPSYQKAALLLPSNMLPGNGDYYDPESDTGSDLPLALKAGSLSPSTRYQIKVSFYQAGAAKSGPLVPYALYSFETVETPQVILPPLRKTSGAPFEYFSAVAGATFDSALFNYNFKLEYPSGEKVCVSCSGANSAHFQIVNAGEYKIHVELWDANGKAMLDEKVSEAIVVTEPASERTAVEAKALTVQKLRDFLDILYKSGDHGGFELIAYQMVEFYRGMTVASDVSDASLVGVVSSRLLSIAMKSLPSTVDGNSGAKTCSSLLSLDPSYVDVTTLYNIMNCILQVPLSTAPEDSLDLAPVAVRAYNYSIAHASSAGTTTRRRLLRQVGSPVNSQLIQTYEAMMQLIRTSLGRDKPCGFSADGSTGLAGAPEFAKSMLPGTFALTVRCKSDEASKLSVEANEFQWCKSFFANKVDQRRVISAFAVPDFVAASAVQGQKRSDSLKLLVTSIDTVSDGILAADPKALNIADCFSMGLVADPTVASQTNPEGFMAAPRSSAMNGFIDTNETLDSSYYRFSKTGIVADPVVFGRKVTFLTSRTGVAGLSLGSGSVVQTVAPTAQSSASLLNVSSIIGMVIGILIFIIVAVLVAWLVATRCLLIAAAPPPPLEPDETYVERDVYGRSVWADDYGDGAARATAGNM